MDAHLGRDKEVTPMNGTDGGPMSIRARVEANALSPHPRSADELAVELGTTRSTIHQAQSRLRRRGRIPVSQRQVTRAIPRLESAPVAVLPTAEELIDGVLSSEGRRRLLSKLATSAPSPVMVSAVRALEEMDRSSGQQVGPPLPVDDSTFAERIGRVLYCGGPEIGRRAIDIAIERWKADEARPGADDRPPGSDRSAVEDRAGEPGIADRDAVN